jgi:hypothetical protein
MAAARDVVSHHRHDHQGADRKYVVLTELKMSMLVF